MAENNTTIDPAECGMTVQGFVDKINDIISFVNTNINTAATFEDVYKKITELEQQGVVTSGGYAVCSTASTEAIKSITIPNLVLAAGTYLTVRFLYANSVDTAALNVNDTGAKNAWYNSQYLGANAWVAGETCLFFYNGREFFLLAQDKGSLTAPKMVQVNYSGNYDTDTILASEHLCGVKPKSTLIDQFGSVITDVTFTVDNMGNIKWTTLAFYINPVLEITGFPVINNINRQQAVDPGQPETGGKENV